MSKDSSFDIVSNLDMQNLDNAVNNAMKEIVNRYDLKNTSSKIELDKASKSLSVVSDSDFLLSQVIQVLYQKMSRLGIDLKSIKSKSKEEIGGNKIKEVFTAVCGIEQEIAKTVIKDIKNLKLKVQSSIQGEQIRISSKSKDELQQVVGFIKQKNYGIPLQFVNYR